MAQIRTLKLNLLADVTKFGAGMIEARGDVNKLSTAATRAGQAVAAAFIGMGVAAGYAAVRIGKESVQAAIDDEASQAKLAKTLQNVTDATDKQIASVEKWITKQQYATGFSDTQIRTSLENLVRVTDDVTEAQKLNNLAMDISRGTGKDLESVSLALAKAHEGNLGALTRLGVPLDENIKKTGDFEAATKKLTDLFGGQAATYAETYQGKLDIMNQRIGELKEGIGADLIGRFSNLLTIINDVAAGFGGENPNEGLSGSVQKFNRATGIDPKSAGFKLGESIQDVATSFQNLFDALTGDTAIDGMSNLERLAAAMQKLAQAIDFVANSYSKAKSALEWVENSWLGQAVRFVTTPPNGRATGGTVQGGQPYRVGEFGPELFIPNGSGRIVPGGGGGSTIINLNGIIDGESARRSIEKLLQDSARRTGAINLAGATL